MCVCVELIDEEQLYMEYHATLHRPTFMFLDVYVCAFGTGVDDVLGDDPIILVLLLTAGRVLTTEINTTT